MTTPAPSERKAWISLGALCIGFFMILVDMTIVAVANPAIMTSLHSDINNVIWVTSAYLLTFAVPLLVTGRLGDKYGPKNLYLIGLTIFTLASLWCGLSNSIGMLIAARAVQGLGASLITPQTMAVITRIFPPHRRGAAMGAWGAVAGVASLVGPIAGGVLVDNLGWEWIFFVNVPIGVIGFLAVVRFVPALETHDHKFDIPGVVMSAVGMFLLVFGLQEGNTYDWNTWIWLLIGGGVAVLAAFIFYQSRTKSEPLLPLGLFRDRNFALGNLGIGAMGAAVTSLMLPTFFYLEAVREWSPTKAALILAPMAVVTGFLAPVVGGFVEKVHPRVIPTFGFALMSFSLVWFATLMDPDTPVWMLLLPGVPMGIASACIWAPLGAIATRNLPMHQAGAGSGVYNTTRQVGSVIGSAAISALITARLAANGLQGGSGGEGMTGPLPEPIKEAFGTALAQSMALPAGVLLLGVLAGVLLEGVKRPKPATPETAEVSSPA